MINTCPSCGLYSTEHLTDKENNKVICANCGHAQSFLFRDLLILTGPSGSGKTTVIQHLQGMLTNTILLEGDILWNDYYNQPDTHYSAYFNQLLRLCKNLNQSGNQVVVANSGLGVPANIEQCTESRYFNRFIYLNLTCSDELLINRLKSRPSWRKSGDETEIQNQLGFKKWLDQQHKDHTLDTSRLSVTETADIVKQWIIDQTKTG
jgi:ribose 1,5-bisphosphokinase PhnN